MTITWSAPAARCSRALAAIVAASPCPTIPSTGGLMQIPKFDVDPWFRRTGVWIVDGDCYSARHGMIRTPSAAAIGAYAA